MNKEQPITTYIASPETFYNEDSMLWETHVGEILEGNKPGQLLITAHGKDKIMSRGLAAKVAGWLNNQK